MNCARFTNIPARVFRFSVDPPLKDEEKWRVGVEWPHRLVSPREVLALQYPPVGLAEGGVRLAGGPIAWRDTPTISGIDAGDLIADLLLKAVKHRARQRGFEQNFDGRLYYYLPVGLCDGEKVHFRLPDGTTTWVNSVGERTYRRLGVSQKYRYHLGASFRVRRDVVPGYVLRVRVVFHMTDAVGQRLPARTVGSRRKQLGKAWWNYEWLSRHLAVLSYFANGEEPLLLGGEAADPLQLEPQFIRLRAAFGINEQALQIHEPESQEREARAEADDDDEEDEDEDV